MHLVLEELASLNASPRIDITHSRYAHYLWEVQPLIEDEDQAHTDAQAHVEDEDSDQIHVIQGDHDSISSWTWFFNCRYVLGAGTPVKFRGAGAMEGASYKYQRDYYTDIHLSLKDKLLDIANTDCGLKLRARVKGLYTGVGLDPEGGTFGISGETISVEANEGEKSVYIELGDGSFVDGEYTWRMTNFSGWPSQGGTGTKTGTGWLMRVVVSSSLTHHFAIVDIDWCLVADSVWALDETNAVEA